jgi:hypothetical protein
VFFGGRSSCLFWEACKFHHYTEWATKKYPAFRLNLPLVTVLISVFMLCYGPGLIFRGPLCILWIKCRTFQDSEWQQEYSLLYFGELRLNIINKYEYCIAIQATDNKIIRRMCIASWISKATNVHLETCFNYQIDAQFLYSVTYVLH